MHWLEETDAGMTTGRTQAVAGLSWVLLCTGLAATLAADAPREGEQMILGWIEEVVIGDQGLHLEAKLDTGADTSSIDASRIRRLRRKSSGERFVEFMVVDPESGDEFWFKEPLVRLARIKQHSGSVQERPVVELDICIGSVARRVQFTLVSREHFDYPVLLGREAMEGVIIVDPAMEDTTEPECERTR
jgi:hypothetical protein